MTRRSIPIYRTSLSKGLSHATQQMYLVLEKIVSNDAKVLRQLTVGVLAVLLLG